MTKKFIDDIQLFATQMRIKMLDISYGCGLSTHLGGGLSMTELMATLYGKVLRFDRNNLKWPNRDRFILSKGHGVLGYFSALLVAGIISDEVYNTFQKNESDLIAHPVMNLDLGIESSNGSLGQGLSMAVGIALAAKKSNSDYKSYVLLGDGECNEGSVWEAVMLASQLKLDNLIAIVDYNKLQSDGSSVQIMDMKSFSSKFDAFGWDVHEINGHDIPQIISALTTDKVINKPRVIVANTVKGKGVSFMENNNEWHHNRLTKSNYELSLLELNDVLKTI